MNNGHPARHGCVKNFINALDNGLTKRTVVSRYMKLVYRVELFSLV